MINEIRFKVTGYNENLEISPDGRYLLIGGYDGGFKVFDREQSKICCKTKLKGPKSGSAIRHLAMSYDSKYAAFSAQKKVYVMDIAKKEIIWEFAFSPQERCYSTAFCFFHHSQKLVIPDGDRLLIHDIETAQDRFIPLPEGAGATDCLALNPSDTHIAYKSGNGVWDLRMDREGNILSDCNDPSDDLSDKIYVYELATGICSLILQVPYPRIRAIQVNLSRFMRFVDDTTVMISRKTIGFSYFNSTTGDEIGLLDWKKKGFEFAAFQFDHPQLYCNGRFVLFNNATPDPDTIKRDENGVAKEYAIDCPDGWEWVLYDIKEDKYVWRKKLGQSPVVFHPDTKAICYIIHERDDNDKRTDYLCICDI